jgi:hypothetical protein
VFNNALSDEFGVKRLSCELIILIVRRCPIEAVRLVLDSGGLNILCDFICDEWNEMWKDCIDCLSRITAMGVLPEDFMYSEEFDLPPTVIEFLRNGRCEEADM